MVSGSRSDDPMYSLEGGPELVCMDFLDPGSYPAISVRVGSMLPVKGP